jgi:hypothetical protein
MPAGGVPWVPHESVLSYEDIFFLIEALEKLGVQKIRFTGGEPLVRKRIKLNTVLIRGFNDDAVEDLVDFAFHKKLILRFIEFMPLDSRVWRKENFVPFTEVLARLEGTFLEERTFFPETSDCRQERQKGQEGRKRRFLRARRLLRQRGYGATRGRHTRRLSAFLFLLQSSAHHRHRASAIVSFQRKAGLDSRRAAGARRRRSTGRALRGGGSEAEGGHGLEPNARPHA